MANKKSPEIKPVAFKAETRQLLDILIHSLYSEREVFLRELISNASDALTRMDYEMLTNREVLNPELELGIWVSSDPEKSTLTIQDNGIGMSEEELAENLGTIAHSGARAFLQVAQQAQSTNHLSDIIGQFGVGFYSAFMVADKIQVLSRSFRPDSQGALWESTGADTFTVGPAEKAERGTIVTLFLKEDAKEFIEKSRIERIVKKHSDFIPYPIYVGPENRQANQQTALWRAQPRQVKEDEALNFYKQFTLDPEPPLTFIHLSTDAPLQVYSLLFVPSSQERNMFSARPQEGLKLYARKVLIQEYNLDLLPEYLRFIDGVVDSEDIPLNVSRESYQASRVMAQLKKLVTGKVLDSLKTMAQEKPEDYDKFWKVYNRSIKTGIATDSDNQEPLTTLLRFHTINSPDRWLTLDDYVSLAKEGQNKIFYLLGDDEHSLIHSPHLDAARNLGYDVILLADPLDPFMLLRLSQYKDFKLENIASADLKVDKPNSENPLSEISKENETRLIDAFKQNLGDKVSDVRTTDSLVESPARLVDPAGTLNPELQRVYKALKQEYKAPQKILEINPHHPILVGIADHITDNNLTNLIIDQIYENALLIEGLHPDPASMIYRIQKIMEIAMKDQKE